MPTGKTVFLDLFINGADAMEETEVPVHRYRTETDRQNLRTEKEKISMVVCERNVLGT